MSTDPKPTQQVFHLLNQQINNILQLSTLTLRGLKRFVKEYKEYLNNGLELNPNGNNKKEVFWFYILFTVGLLGDNWHGITDVTTFVKEKFGNDKINIDDEISDKLLSEMLETERYFEIIKSGANIIENWKYE